MDSSYSWRSPWPAGEVVVVTIVIELFFPEMFERLQFRLANPHLGIRQVALRDENGNIRIMIVKITEMRSLPVANMFRENGGRAESTNTGTNNLANDAATQREREREREQLMYFDMGWSLANLLCSIQLGGLRGANFTVTQLLPTACYISLAAASVIVSLPVLLRPHRLSPALRKLMLLAGVVFLVLDYWFIKPLLSS